MDEVKQDQKKFGKCPLCSKYHTFKGRSGIQASNKVIECPVYIALNVKDKAKKCIDKEICLKCLSWLHKRGSCPYSYLKCTYKDGDDVCGKPHHKTLHRCGDPKVLAVARVSKAGEPRPYDILPAVVEVEPKPGLKMLATLDPGSNSSIMTHRGARKLNLKGKFCLERVQLCGKEEETQETCSYTLKWDIKSKTRLVKFLGMDSITDLYGPGDVNKAYAFFPQYQNGELDRPQGSRIDMLLGLDQAHLMPGGGLGEDQVDSLRVMTTPLGTGRVLIGHHPNLAVSEYRLTPQVINARQTKYLDRATSVSHNMPKVINVRHCKSCCVPDLIDLTDLPKDIEEQETGPQNPGLTLAPARGSGEKVAMDTEFFSDFFLEVDTSKQLIEHLTKLTYASDVFTFIKTTFARLARATRLDSCNNDSEPSNDKL